MKSALILLIVILSCSGCASDANAFSGARQLDMSLSSGAPSDAPSYGSNVLKAEDWLILQDPFSKLTYRMPSDGGAIQRIDDTAGREEIKYVGGWLYYLLPVQGGKRQMFRMRLDGTGKEKLPIEPLAMGEDYAAAADCLYFARQVGQERGLFYAGADGTEAHLVYAGENIRDLRIKEGRVYFRRTLLSASVQSFSYKYGENAASPAARSVDHAMSGWYYSSGASGKITREMIDGSSRETLNLFGQLAGCRDGYLVVYHNGEIYAALPDGSDKRTLWQEKGIEALFDKGMDIVGNYLYFVAARYWPLDQPTPKRKYGATPAPEVKPAGRLHRLNLATGELQIFELPRMELTTLT